MKKNLLVGFMSVLLFVSGCKKTFDVVNTEFPQAKQHEICWKTIKDSLRSITLYDGFETRAHFDVLWMSDKMRSLYASLKSGKLGHNAAEKDAFLAQQLEENNHKISFYVLCEVSDPAHVSLTDDNSVWSVYLQLAGARTLKPLSLQEVDLEPELMFVFGHRFALYKKTYKIDFQAKNLSGQMVLQPGDSFQMICADAGMQSSISWAVPQMCLKSDLEKEHLLKKEQESTWFDFLKSFAKPKNREADFFW